MSVSRNPGWNGSGANGMTGGNASNGGGSGMYGGTAGSPYDPGYAGGGEDCCFGAFGDVTSCKFGEHDTAHTMEYRDAMAPPNMTYHGMGQNDYARQPNYQYLGRGAGKFGVQQVPTTPKSTKCWCMVLPIVLACLLLLPLSYCILQPGTKTITTSLAPKLRAAVLPKVTPIPHPFIPAFPPGVVPMSHHSVAPSSPSSPHSLPQLPTAIATLSPKPTSGQFDCNAGYANWAIGWSRIKKTWCCEHKHMGCTKSLPSTTHKVYDCSAGYINWQHGWSKGKKDWCCKQEGRGCTATPCPTS